MLITSRGLKVKSKSSSFSMVSCLLQIPCSCCVTEKQVI